MLKEVMKERGDFNEEEASVLIKGILEGLSYVHHLNYMHRDIKPENLIIDERTHSVKIIDFGFAVQQNNIISHLVDDNIGTLLYMAPE